MKLKTEKYTSDERAKRAEAGALADGMHSLLTARSAGRAEEAVREDQQGHGDHVQGTAARTHATANGCAGGDKEQKGAGGPGPH